MCSATTASSAGFSTHSTDTYCGLREKTVTCGYVADKAGGPGYQATAGAHPTSRYCPPACVGLQFFQYVRSNFTYDIFIGS